MYQKLNDGSYVHNCFIKRRETEKEGVLFRQNGDESVIVMLNGYAVIPIEDYFELANERGSDGNDWPDDMLKSVEEADEWLHT